MIVKHYDTLAQRPATRPYERLAHQTTALKKYTGLELLIIGAVLSLEDNTFPHVPSITVVCKPQEIQCLQAWDIKKWNSGGILLHLTSLSQSFLTYKS